jgi:hypothetical protein
MDTSTAKQYLRANFVPTDRIAIVALHRGTNDVKQRVDATERIAQDDFQRWLRFFNKEGYEIYVSMNTLREDAHGRKKTDVGQIRHVYLDFDDNGSEAVRQMMTHSGMSRPNHLIESSPGKWQAIWRVQGFEMLEAENLMRRMVREFGADPAAIDSARVLRLPGFYNHKYDQPHFITVQNLSSAVYAPSDFPQFAAGESEAQASTTPRVRKAQSGITQSERDWAFAKRALGRGEDPQEVIRSIAQFRTDKPNPRYYAEHTVQKAQVSLQQGRRSAEKVTATAKAKEGLSLGLW